MGLFSRRKKPSAADAQAAAAATRAAEDARREAARLATEAAARAARDDVRAKEDHAVQRIAQKRKDIAQLQKALNGFEEQRRREAALAVKARDEKRMNVAKSHLRNATRLKEKMAQYERQVVQNQTQLDTLEDVAFQRMAGKNVVDFVDDVKVMKQDPEKIDDALQDMRDAMANVNEVNMTLEADANMNKGIYDTEDAMAELDALEAEFGEEARVDLPSVPAEKPEMPVSAVAPASRLDDDEEEQIRRLEQDVVGM